MQILTAKKVSIRNGWLSFLFRFTVVKYLCLLVRMGFNETLQIHVAILRKVIWYQQAYLVRLHSHLTVNVKVLSIVSKSWVWKVLSGKSKTYKVQIKFNIISVSVVKVTWYCVMVYD